jgi:hypothetical protein
LAEIARGILWALQSGNPTVQIALAAVQFTKARTHIEAAT